MTPDYLGYGLDPVPVPWADLKNPQSLNLYGYVRNNPTTLDDPDGHDCVVQTRTGSNTENVTVSSGNCDNVKVGDGQTKTFVDGTVTSIKPGADGRSIDIGFRANDGSGAVGVQNANAASYPDRPGLAYGFNQDGYRTLAQASKTVDKIAWATLGMMGAATCVAACSAAGAAIVSQESAVNATALRIMAFLESKGIPATAAAALAAKALSRMGTQPRLGEKIKLGRELVQQLNQTVREYFQSQGAH